MGGTNEEQEDAVMSLALLQNKIKRDPEAYREEFLLQLANFQGLLSALKQQPHRPTVRLQRLAMFLAHTAPCYSAEAADAWVSGEASEASRPFEAFASGEETAERRFQGGVSYSVQVKEAMQQLLANAELHPSTRHALLIATFLLRSKKMLSCEELLQQALSLLSLRDKFVRQRLMAFVVKDVSRVFSSTTNNQARGLLLNRLFGLLKTGSSPLPPRLALCCLFQVYRHLNAKGQIGGNNNASKIVNAVAGATLAGDGKLASSAALFLLGEIQAAATRASHAIHANEEETDEEIAAAAAAELQQNKSLHSKKTLAAKKKLKKQQQRMQKRLVRKQQRAEQQHEHLGTSASAALLDLIYDPQSLAEKLFGRVRQQRDSFWTRLLFLNLLSRLVSHHKLLLLNIYPYMQRYLNPSQRLISGILAVCANLVHAGLPPQEALPLVKDIANNFVNDTRGEQVLTLGLNAITEICSRNPLCMTEELLGDLLQYTKHKSSKSVSVAARRLLNLYRETLPVMLPKVYLGREAAIQLQRDNVALPEFGAFCTSRNLSLLPQLEALRKRSRKELQQELGCCVEGSDKETDGEETDGEETDGEETDGKETEGEETDAGETDEEETETLAEHGQEGDSTGAASSDTEGDTEKETVEERDEEETEGKEQQENGDEEEPKPKKRRVQTEEAAAKTEAAAAAAETEEAAAAACGTRILTDADFAALRLLRAKQLAHQVRGGPRRGGGVELDAERDAKLYKLLTAEADSREAAEAVTSSSDEDSEEEQEASGGKESAFVVEKDLEGLAGRKLRQAKERNRNRDEKLQNKRLGLKSKWPQEQKDTNGSKPQHVKNRSKPLLMVQQSRRLRQKKQLSVTEKAANLKKRIKNLKKSFVGKPRRRKR